MAAPSRRPVNSGEMRVNAGERVIYNYELPPLSRAIRIWVWLGMKRLDIIDDNRSFWASKGRFTDRIWSQLWLGAINQTAPRASKKTCQQIYEVFSKLLPEEHITYGQVLALAGHYDDVGALLWFLRYDDEGKAYQDAEVMARDLETMQTAEWKRSDSDIKRTAEAIVKQDDAQLDKKIARIVKLVRAWKQELRMG